MIIVYYGIGGGLLFFAFIFLLFFIQNSGYATAETINNFYSEHMTGIIVTFTIITILTALLATLGARAIRENSHKKSNGVGSTVAYAIGAFMVLAQSSLCIVSGVHDPFTHKYGGFLIIFSFIISIILIIIDLAISYAVLIFGAENKIGVFLMYVWAVAGAFIFSDFLKIIVPGA
ncbi:MAG: hypothetical protein IJV48_00720 [Ruminococcus sp.]|nr:hypothetical protein [Ruminococcus sp.]